jgi:hypothetical protein
VLQAAYDFHYIAHPMKPEDVSGLFDIIPK